MAAENKLYRYNSQPLNKLLTEDLDLDPGQVGNNLDQIMKTWCVMPAVIMITPENNSNGITSFCAPFATLCGSYLRTTREKIGIKQTTKHKHHEQRI